jgi:transposase
MARRPNMPNGEHCTLMELETAAKAAVSRKSHIGLMAIKGLLLGISHDQVAKLYGTTRRTLSRWVARFNDKGIDGLIRCPGSGRPPKITGANASEYVELIKHPAKAAETHWTAKKFHGYLTEKLEHEIGYRTVVRWLHDQGFRLKVPRSWPNGQDEEERKAFLELIRVFLGDPDIDLWYLDESGIEGDPRPRRRWALRGEKIFQPYQGTHVRMSVTGTVCPRTGELYSLIYSHSDAAIFQNFLDNANNDIQFERPRNLIILDNANWHKGKKTNWGRFEPIYLPPYSPDLNPIERLWLLIKAEWFSDFYAKNTDDLIDRICRALNWAIDRRELNKKTCRIPI